MYYLFHDLDDKSFAIRSFPRELYTMWCNNLLNLFEYKDMINHNGIHGDTIEEYSSFNPYYNIIATFDTCPTLEQAQSEYPELFI